MPEIPPIVAAFLSLVAFVALSGAFTGLVFLLRWLRTLEPSERRPVPWGGFSVLSVVGTWVVVNIVVSGAYLYHKHRSHHEPTASTPSPHTRSPTKTDQKTAFKTSKPSEPGPPRSATVTPPPTSVKEAPRLTFKEQMLLISVINAILLVVVPLTVRLGSGARREDMGLTFKDFGRNVCIGAAAFVLVTPLVMAISLVVQLLWRGNRHPLEQMLRQGASPGAFVLAYISAAILAPAAEELLFRGILQAWLRRALNQKFTPGSSPDVPAPLPPDAEPVDAATPAPTGSGRRWLPRPPAFLASRLADPEIRGALPVVVTSLIFALVHAPQMPAPIPIFFLSLVLGRLYEATGSLVPSFVLHALFNGFNTTLLVVALLVTPSNHDGTKTRERSNIGDGKRAKSTTFPLARGVWADTVSGAVSFPIESDAVRRGGRSLESGSRSGQRDPGNPENSIMSGGSVVR